MVEERAHTASTAALAEATERLTSLAVTPPLPDHAVWAERAAELERSALVAFDGRALAGAAAAAARHTLAESVRREASQQLGALLRVSRQVCEDAAVLAGAGAMAEPAAAAAEGYAPAEMVGGLVQAYEDEAQGPARYDGLRSLLTSQLAPWLAQVAAAQAAARDQVAAAARAEHEREREARRDAELALATASGEVATKAEGIARLEAGALAMTQRADEQAAQLQQLTVARLEAQAESAAQLATAQQQLAAAKAEAQLSSSQGELQLERARSAAEAAGLSQAAAMAKLEQEHEKAGAAAAARLQAAEDAQLQTQAVMSTFRAEALEAREAQGQLECSLATARTEAREATAARTAAEAAEACARGDAVVGAVEEYVTALEVAEERGRKRGASQEELDSLRLQLAELHERLALLPDFYVQQVFGAEAKPGSLIDALLPDRDGEAPQRNESVALLVPPQLAASAAWEDLGCGHALRRSASAAQASVVACTWYLRPHVRATCHHSRLLEHPGLSLALGRACRAAACQGGAGVGGLCRVASRQHRRCGRHACAADRLTRQVVVDLVLQGLCRRGRGRVAGGGQPGSGRDARGSSAHGGGSGGSGGVLCGGTRGGGGTCGGACGGACGRGAHRRCHGDGDAAGADAAHGGQGGGGAGQRRLNVSR